MTQKELSGKISLVTGSGKGIGKSIALKLAQMGSRVAVNDLPGSTGASEVVKKIESLGGEAMLALADVTDSAAVKASVNSVVGKWGRIDILVNNAGITGKYNITMRIKDSDWDRILDTNLRGAFLYSKHVLRSMTGQNWGRIINIASIAGLYGLGMVDYSTSKGGLITFTRSLAHEIGPQNITVNAIAPGYIVSDMSEALSQEMKDMLLSRIGLKRFGTTEEIAELAAFLATDRASYITGQVISIDGGFM